MNHRTAKLIHPLGYSPTTTAFLGNPASTPKIRSICFPDGSTRTIFRNDTKKILLKANLSSTSCPTRNVLSTRRRSNNVRTNGKITHDTSMQDANNNNEMHLSSNLTTSPHGITKATCMRAHVSRQTVCEHAFKIVMDVTRDEEQARIYSHPL